MYVAYNKFQLYCNTKLETVMKPHYLLWLKGRHQMK